MRSDAGLVSGIDSVLDLVAFDDLLTRASAVVTGERPLDEQTANGKVVDGVLRRARRHQVPVWAVAGQTRRIARQIENAGLSGVIETGSPQELTDAGRRLTRYASVTPPRTTATELRPAPHHAPRRTSA